jgi:hypothetical protein
MRDWNGRRSNDLAPLLDILPQNHERLTPSRATHKVFVSPEAILAADDGMYHISEHHVSTTIMPYDPPTINANTSMPSNILQDYESITDSPYPFYAQWMTQPLSIASEFCTPSPRRHLLSCSTLLSQPFDTTPLSTSHSTLSPTDQGTTSSVPSVRSSTTLSRSPSHSSPNLRSCGIPNKDGTWSCAFPGCTSRAVFTRVCDLRKHYKRHTKSFFCSHGDCPQSTGGGFSTKRDLARHEAKHNPGVRCDWDGCNRVFSRVDNMVNRDSLPWENVLR